MTLECCLFVGMSSLEIFDHVEFDKWVEKAIAPAIEPSLKLYEQVLSLGFKVFLLTGRAERHRKVTVENLINTGFRYWDKLILRGPDDHGKLAVLYKSEKISEMEREGYRILGNSGDQWSDLLGTRMSTRSFKLPNPIIYEVPMWFINLNRKLLNLSNITMKIILITQFDLVDLGGPWMSGTFNLRQTIIPHVVARVPPFDFDEEDDQSITR
ncbi:Acid phosphatase 1 [Morus notabilis]|uniref:Acid phosphatase 1 n=1 Tax=Morus notabilis TaxID=981085 RepID=W9S1G3_9ROSA|nr:Acid phosphatase 1 [Morus notabilis]